VPEQSLAKFDIDAIGRVGESAETEGLGVTAFAAEAAGDQCPVRLKPISRGDRGLFRQGLRKRML
jgi:hypothetical protein